MELKKGQYYIDNIFHIIIIFEEEKYGYYWFYCPEENRYVPYENYELINIGRY